ncbi:MAG: hypothetical protein ACFFER_19090 [Candidatus Thorarchaeota archaeon]
MSTHRIDAAKANTPIAIISDDPIFKYDLINLSPSIVGDALTGKFLEVAGWIYHFSTSFQKLHQSND